MVLRYNTFRLRWARYVGQESDVFKKKLVVLTCIELRHSYCPYEQV